MTTTRRPRVQLTIPSKALAVAFILLAVVPLLNMVLLLGPLRSNGDKIEQANQERACITYAGIPLRDAESNRDNILARLVSAAFNRAANVAEINAELVKATVEVDQAFQAWRTQIVACQT